MAGKQSHKNSKMILTDSHQENSHESYVEPLVKRRGSLAGDARCDRVTRAAPSLVAPSSTPEPQARDRVPRPLRARAGPSGAATRASVMSSSPSTRRKLLLDSEDAPDDDQPCAWTCSYVMSSGDGVNLLGVLDVDKNRARFVANSGLFGTAYQFVMPRDQIQIVRVPSASAPYNALELHTKYRQNILCDFDDNVATFRRCCEVMKLDVLPQDEPLIAVLPTDVSDHANKWRARAAAKRREREAAEALAARGGGEPDDGHQLTQQVMHLHGEKVALQRRMTELERENEHLHGEVDVLYAQVDEQSERAQRQRETLEAAAREAVDDALKKSADDTEDTDDTEEGVSVKPEPPKFLRASRTEKGEKENRLEANVPAGDGGAAVAKTDARPADFPTEKLKHGKTRQDELVRSVASLRSERAAFEGEVARLRAELERREKLERETKLLADAEAEAAEKQSPDDDMQDMLASEVQRLLAKQAELSSHLASARREKQMLEKENELLYHKSEAVEEAAETARAEKALAWERLSLVSAEERGARSARAEGSIAPSSPPREEELTLQSPAGTLGTKPFPMASEKLGGALKKKQTDDGPDAELAAKLIGRLERGGESLEAASLKLEMERMKAELGRMRAERAASALPHAADEHLAEPSSGLARSGAEAKAEAEAAAAALRAELEEKEEELRMEKRRAAAAVAAAAERAAAEAAAREKEEALWHVTEAELRAADAERALDALRLEKEASERTLALVTEELRSERSRSRAGSVSRADDRARDSETARKRGSADTEGTRDDRSHSPARSSSELSGWSVPERVWQEILLEKESALSALSERDKAKEDELTRLRDRLARLERRGVKEAKEASTPSPPKPPVGSRSRAVAPNEDVADRRATDSRPNENAVGAGVSLPAIDVSGGDAKSLSRADSPSAKAASPSAKSPRSPFTKGLTGLGVAAAGFVFGKLSPQ